MTLKFQLKTSKFKSCNPLFYQCNANRFYIDYVTKNLLAGFIFRFVYRPPFTQFDTSALCENSYTLGQKIGIPFFIESLSSNQSIIFVSTAMQLFLLFVCLFQKDQSKFFCIVDSFYFHKVDFSENHLPYKAL